MVFASRVESSLGIWDDLAVTAGGPCNAQQSLHLPVRVVQHDPARAVPLSHVVASLAQRQPERDHMKLDSQVLSVSARSGQGLQVH